MSKPRTCILAIGSETHAMKAQAALAASAIPARIVKIDASAATRGCMWGLSVSAAQKNNVKLVLSSAAIPVKAWLEE